jgi:hypothetical protein
MSVSIRQRPSSATTVVFVLLFTTLLQAGISSSMTFGRLADFISSRTLEQLQLGWLIVRGCLMVAVLVLWALNRKRALFRAIIVANGILTIGLLASAAGLTDVLFALSTSVAGVVLGDVVLMAAANILIFSIWYWIIDPPGIDENQPLDAPWDFLFPQRGSDLPHYASWTPKYTDYLYLAFNTTFAFSPADTLPLSARAKWMMMLQASISIVTIVVIAGAALNTL